MASEPVVVTRDLAVGSAHAPLAAEMSLAVAAGEAVAIVGANGSGKTTLLATLALLQAPAAGRLELMGCATERLREADRAALRRRIGTALGDGPWLADATASENLVLPLRVHGEDEAEIGVVAGEFLAWLGLGERAAVPARALSRGERRLLATARAAIARPDLLLLDEPLEGLDEPAVARTARLVTELAALGCAVVVATARPETARRLGCEPLALAGGRLRVGTAPLRAVS